MEENTDQTKWAPKTFFFEAVSGILIFITIALAAIFLSYSVSYLEAIKFDPVIIYGLKAAEYAIFGCDLFLFAVFLFATTKKTYRGL
ncbi:MAG: hypothetical protein MJK10_03730 [Pseudomonadales bacterium]|nr:hypothetical protein [Pseudomonadales bacterium]NRA15182.1 hypothetical protein [Oceanospirillaceae bacterium]